MDSELEHGGDECVDQVAREWAKGYIDDNEFVETIYPHIKRISAYYARKCFIPDLGEDVAQSVTLALMEKSKWDKERPFLKYASGFAWRIALTLAKEHNTEVAVDSFFDNIEVGLYDESSSPESTLEAGDELSIEKRSVLIEIDEEKLDELVGEKKPVETKKRQDDRHKRINHKIKALRDQAAMTREEVADGLGMPLWRYFAYETGKMKPHDGFMRTMEKYVENARPRRVYGWMHGASVRVIIRRWCDELGIEPGEEKLSEITQISTRTLNKWYESNDKPKLSRLAQCYDRILRHKAQRKIGGAKQKLKC